MQKSGRHLTGTNACFRQRELTFCSLQEPANWRDRPYVTSPYLCLQMVALPFGGLLAFK